MCKNPSMFRRTVVLISTLLIGSAFLAVPAHAQPDSGFRQLSVAEQRALVDQKAYIPAGVGITLTYVQDSPQAHEVLLCYNAAFEPLMLPKATGAWMLMQGNGGVGAGTFVYQYLDAKAAKAAGKALLATKCAAEGQDPKWKLQQSQRMLPKKSGAPGVLIATTMVDDGELETNENAFRQVGMVVLKVGATYSGAANSALGKKVRPALIKALDELTANYVKAAKS